MVKRACYRVGQFLRALTARVSDEEIEQATRILTPQARALFRRQTVQDQRHALAVYRALQRAGHTDPHLLAAALLHDAGKAAARIPPSHRAVIALLERFAPRLLTRSSRGKPTGWNRPFVIYARHPATGARWAREAGCSSLTATLIRRHEEEQADGPGEEERLLAALQAADSTH